MDVERMSAPPPGPTMGMPRFQSGPRFSMMAGGNAPMAFDGKRMRNKSVLRRTVDYNPSVVNYLETRLWQRDGRDMHAIQSDNLYQTKILPPMSMLSRPMNCVTTKFVRTSTNKIRCPIFCVCWTPEGRRLITGASSGEFTLWNGLTFNFETILQAHDSSVRAMVWSQNSKWMLTADHAGYVKYWQCNMNNVKMYQAHKDPVRGLRSGRCPVAGLGCGRHRTVDRLYCYGYVDDVCCSLSRSVVVMVVQLWLLMFKSPFNTVRVMTCGNVFNFNVVFIICLTCLLRQLPTDSNSECGHLCICQRLLIILHRFLKCNLFYWQMPKMRKSTVCRKFHNFCTHLIWMLPYDAYIPCAHNLFKDFCISIFYLFQKHFFGKKKYILEFKKSSFMFI